MTITAALVLFSIIWFLVFFMVLPQQIRSQGEAGSVVPGTPSSAPQDAMIGRKAKITTVIAAVLWVGLTLIITSGWIGVEDLDIFGLTPEKF